jgi:PPIC-type PPIASE domain
MPSWLTKLQPSPWLLRKLLMLAIIIGVGAGAFFYGRRQPVGAKTPDELGLKPGDPDYCLRAVAYLYNNTVKVTREELGEYLIARFGPERLEFMINRKIVEMECYKHNITATDQEVEDRFQQDLKSFGPSLTQADFVNNILRRFGKSLYEWKEDVIRPKIMMEKLVQSKVQITDADVREGFEAKYGPRVECRMIVLEKGNEAVAQKVLDNARKGYANFLEEARKQFIPNLAAEGGKVPPIHKHFGDKELENTAFRLKEGEVSGLLTMKDGTLVILYCEKHLPANVAVRFEDERQKLAKEMFELRVAQRIPEAFQAMKAAATTRMVLSNAGQASANVIPPAQPLPQPHHPITVPVEIPPPPVPQPITPPAGYAPSALPDKLPMPEIKLPPVPMPPVVPMPTTTLTPMPMPPVVTPPAAKKN